MAKQDSLVDRYQTSNEIEHRYLQIQLDEKREWENERGGEARK